VYPILSWLSGNLRHWDGGFPAHASGAQYAHWPVGTTFEGFRAAEFEVEVEVEEVTVSFAVSVALAVGVEVEEMGLEGLCNGANTILSTSRRKSSRSFTSSFIRSVI